MNARARFNAALLSLFAGMGVPLAALGVYGVLAFLVSQQVREIGVRMALGATRGRIVKWLLVHAMSWAVIGLALGTAGAFVAAQRSPLSPPISRSGARRRWIRQSRCGTTELG